jgi:uncharacterized protein YbjT (DUF2867 family)
MFVIAGITGNTGSAAAESLLAQGKALRVIVRNPAKASEWAKRGVEIVTGELDDAAVLERAFAGAEGAYMLVPPLVTTDDPLAWYSTVAHATRKAVLASKLPRLVFLSSEGAHLSSGNGPIKGLYDAEHILAGVSGVTFLRASYFQENWESLIGLAAAQGILPSMLSDLDQKRSMIATVDIGRTAAALLLEANPPAIVELESGNRFSVRDVAEAMGQALGKPVQPVLPPRESWVGILTGAGLSKAFAELIAEMNDGINSGHIGFSGKAEKRQGPTKIADTIRHWASALPKAA